MSGAFAQDFLDDVALELYVLEKVAPLLVSHTAAQCYYDPKTDQMTMGLNAHFRIGGMDLPAAVEDLGIRPLAFGSAWKILDLLLEYSLSAAGIRPSNGSRWTITEKTRHARAGTGQASPLSTNLVARV